jgi:hypothetical protein
MLHDVIAALVSFLLIEPLQAEMAEKLGAARVPQAAIADVTSCAGAATPAIVSRAASDPWWAVSSAVGLWIGSASPEALLADAAPGCASALKAARPLAPARAG